LKPKSGPYPLGFVAQSWRRSALSKDWPIALAGDNIRVITEDDHIYRKSEAKEATKAKFRGGLVAAGDEMKVREAIKMIEQDGWFQVATRGSHRQYKHPTKKGRVTIAGKPSDDLAPGTLNSILKQADLKDTR
jgi:predicted RNA binding protein YcfA (HicA-like mRNA interferase family)